MTYQSQNEFIGEKIKSFRKKRNLTQEALGAEIGVKDNTISAYERGVIEIPHSKLLGLAKALDVKYTELLPLEKDGTDEKGGLVAEGSIADYMASVEKSLTADQFHFFEKLIDQTLSLSNKERENFLKNIRFAVEYFNREN